MPSDPRVPLWRWLLVPVAATVAFVAVLYFNLFAIVLGPFPRDLADPTAGALAGSVIVLAGALAAPRWRPVVGLAVAVCAIVLNRGLQLFWPVPVAVAAVSAAGFVAWLDSPRRTPRATRVAKIAGWAAVLGFLGLVGARYVDLPAWADATPVELEGAWPAGAHLPAIYVYDLGGFIDREWLWRLDGDAGSVARVASVLSLERVAEVPPRFWTMPPYYWPRAMPEGAVAYSSRSFDAVNRGQDGSYYFLVHDARANRAYVWYKFNF
jgi:hypothetical protein